jgi:myo-inositol-1-phosphate synthase
MHEDSTKTKSPRRVGLWLVGAHGGVGSTTALGLAALGHGQIAPTGLVTKLPEFANVDFDEPDTFVVGGHDSRSTFRDTVEALHSRSNIFAPEVLDECAERIDAWQANIRPAVTLEASATPWAAVDRVVADITAFRARHKLDDVVVVNVASTEPPATPLHANSPREAFEAALATNGLGVPMSTLYAWAAVAAGCPYVNLTPSLGGSFPAFEEHCKHHKVPHLGQDAKTGETLLKSVLAPMFRQRNLRVLSWVGHNILGNNDGRVLANPANKASKIRTKDALLGELLDDKPQSHVSIEFIESLDDWKTAWDHIHFEGFLGVKMTLQFTWQGCDSALAAPLVIDLARLALLAHRRGAAGALAAAACFFKSPLGASVHDLASQFGMFKRYVLG